MTSKINLIYFAAGVFTLFIHCNSGTREKVQPGMDESDVESILGEPICIEAGIPQLSTDAETLTVTKRKTSEYISWIYTSSKERKTSIRGKRRSFHFLLNEKEVNYSVYSAVSDGEYLYYSPEKKLISRQEWINYKFASQNKTPDPVIAVKKVQELVEPQSQMIDYVITECYTVVFDRRKQEVIQSGYLPRFVLYDNQK